MISWLIPYIKRFRILIYLAFISGFVLSCANMASPSGGDYDFDPPVVVRSTPAFNATNVKTDKIQIVFDELVQIENPNEKVIVTPPQTRIPKIQAISNRVIVELKDTLLPHTTYTIDFTDAIADNNEKNPLNNFSMSFSTGDVVDSLSISGKVLTANNLEPVKGIYVGLHSDLSDSAFIKKIFDRISRTNDRGEFTIKGVAEGKYRLYALNDPNRNFKYENPANEIAFLDSLIVPSHTRAFRSDTLFRPDMSIDTIKTVAYTRFLPDNILLRSFVSDFQRQFLQKHERSQENELRIYFGGVTPLADIKPLNFDGDKPWNLLEHTLRNDTLKYWITDSVVMKMDTIVLQVSYQITDSLNNLQPKTDTLSFINRKIRPQPKAARKKDEKEPVIFLELRNNLRPVINVYDDILIKFGQPVRDFDESKFVLQHLVDTLYVDEKINLIKDSLNPTQYTIKYKWKPGDSYRFAIDSAAFRSYTGLENDKLNTSFKVKSLEEYGKLYINIDGLYPDEQAFVELLGTSDFPVRRANVKNGGVLFLNLDPSKYFARIVIDANNNGKWDTGDYYKKLQPEEVYYYNSSWEVKAFWEVEESWNIRSIEPDKQKPLEITRNKPQEKESKRKQLEQNEAKSRQQKQNTNPNGMTSPANMPRR
ncbi:Ig-like domain-containing domain [Viscerimonas tarda]